MQTKPSNWKNVFQNALIGGGISIFLSLVGMVTAFNERYIIADGITFGQITLYAPIFLLTYLSIRSIASTSKSRVFMWGLLSGAIGGSFLALLVLVGNSVNLRAMFINATDDLYNIITSGVPLPLGLLVPVLVGAFLGGLAAGLYLLSPRWRSTILQASAWVFIFGLMRDLIFTVIIPWGVFGSIVSWMFALNGMTLLGAILLFIFVAFFSYRNYGKKGGDNWVTRLPPRRQKFVRWGAIFAGFVVALLLPFILGIFFSEILDNVGIYILMGLGLNIVIGFAGLLDLGYVAFYAIGAYTIAVLTSPELGFAHLTFWQAFPIALFMAVLAGVILGLPVLRLRGDYLAIVTLGFGEIIRLLALSDWLRPFLGGTQGIQQIAQPQIGNFTFNTQQSLYYLILFFIIVAGFVAWRLKDSKVGRTWMAMREDEDVARAMGINTVLTKLLAFGTGAFFSGLAGTLFAAKLGSSYPTSFNFFVSINVLSLIIVGGMGSIPGVFVGALVLIGAPEVLREFSDFRFMFYGAVLVAMMLFRPEGLWPEARRKLELHEEVAPPIEPGQDTPAVLGTQGQ
jgi:branched-chain amino acid transport system permease protein